MEITLDTMWLSEIPNLSKSSKAFPDLGTPVTEREWIWMLDLDNASQIAPYIYCVL